MQYTRSALGLLTRQYKSVLKKCFLIDCGLFALGVMSATPARADIDLTELSRGSIVWEKSDASVLDKYTWADDMRQASDSIHHEDEAGNLLYTDGAIRFVNSNSDTEYYIYRYTTPDDYVRVTTNYPDGASEDFPFENSYAYGFVRQTYTSYGIIGVTTSGLAHDIDVDFLGNTILYGAWGRGGAAITLCNHGVAQNISGNFIDNKAEGIRTGAVAIQSATLQNISGNFINNRTDQAHGGAMRLGYSKADSIIGNFIGNNVTDARAIDIVGGALDAYGSDAEPTDIGVISGKFIANSAVVPVSGGSASGGAIAIRWSPQTNVKHLDGDFVANYVSTIDTKAMGGAIYHELAIIGTIDEEGNLNGGIVNSNFYSNYAKSETGTAQGGAIWTNKSLNIIADNGTSTFQGNYVQVGDEKDDQAIWVNSADATLTFEADNNGEIFMYDNINGVEATTTDPETSEEVTTRYKVNITGDGTGTMHLYNNIYNGDVNVANTTLEIGTSVVNTKNIAFAADSSLVLTVNSLEDYGSLTAENITVENGAQLKATLAQGIVKIGEDKTIKLLTADNTDFNNFNDVYDNTMYHFEKADKNGLYKISLVKTAEDVVEEAGGTEAEAEAASAWVDGAKFAEGTIAAEVANALADLAQNNPQELSATLSTIMPDEAPSTQETMVGISDQLMLDVGSHLAGYENGGLSSGDELSGVSLWGKGYYGKSKLDSHKSIKGFDVKKKGVIVGMDKDFGTIKIGVGLQYEKDDIDAFRRDTDVETLMGFAYGEYRLSNWFVNAVAAYGRASYDENKFALGMKIHDRYSAGVYSLQAITGYDFKYLTPEIGARYYYIKRHGYKDSIGQQVAGKDMDLLRGVFGVRTSYRFGMFKPELYVGVTYDFVSDEDKATVGLPNGASYMVNGKRLNRFGTEVNANVAAYITDKFSATLGYEGKYRSHYQDHTGMFSIKYEF